MRLIQRGVVAFIALGLTAGPVQASLSNCIGIYVISVSFPMYDPRPRVVFAESPSATSGSQVIYPSTGFTDLAYQQLYATLLSAKLASKPVSVKTSATDQCSITSGSPYLISVELG